MQLLRHTQKKTLIKCLHSTYGLIRVGKYHELFHRECLSCVRRIIRNPPRIWGNQENSHDNEERLIKSKTKQKRLEITRLIKSARFACEKKDIFA